AVGHEGGDVVHFHAVGHADQPPRAHLDRVGLVVVAPVRDPLDARLGEQVEGIEGLGEAGPEPALRGLPGGGLDHVERLTYHRALGDHSQAVEGARVVDAVTHHLPAPLLALAHDLWVVGAHLGVEGRRGAQVVLVQDVHQAPDADAAAVVAPTGVQRI